LPFLGVQPVRIRSRRRLAQAVGEEQLRRRDVTLFCLFDQLVSDGVKFLVGELGQDALAHAGDFAGKRVAWAAGVARQESSFIIPLVRPRRGGGVVSGGVGGRRLRRRP